MEKNEKRKKKQGLFCFFIVPKSHIEPTSVGRTSDIQAIYPSPRGAKQWNSEKILYIEKGGWELNQLGSRAWISLSHPNMFGNFREQTRMYRSQEEEKEKYLEED